MACFLFLGNGNTLGLLLAQQFDSPGHAAAAAHVQCQLAARMILRHLEINCLGKFFAAVRLHCNINGYLITGLNLGVLGAHVKNFRHLHRIADLCLYINAVNLHRLKLILHQNRYSLRQLRIQVFQQRIIGIIHIFAINRQHFLLAVHAGNGKMQLGRTAAVAVHSLAHSIDYRRIHHRRHQLLVVNQTHTHAVGLSAAAVINSNKHRNRIRLLADHATDTAGTVLSNAADCLAQIAYLIAALQVRHYAQHPHLIHKEIAAAALHKGMAEGQNLTAVIGPGNSTESAQSHITLHQSNTDTAARLQRLIAGSACAAAVDSSQAEGLQLLLQIFHTVFRKTACHQRRSFRNPVCRQLSRFVQQRQHFADWCQEAVMRVVEGLAEGHSTDKSAVYINRTAAHALSNTACLFNQIAVKAHKNIISHSFTAVDT